LPNREGFELVIALFEPPKLSPVPGAVEDGCLLNENPVAEGTVDVEAGLLNENPPEEGWFIPEDDAVLLLFAEAPNNPGFELVLLFTDPAGVAELAPNEKAGFCDAEPNILTIFD